MIELLNDEQKEIIYHLLMLLMETITKFVSFCLRTCKLNNYHS